MAKIAMPFPNSTAEKLQTRHGQGFHHQAALQGSKRRLLHLTEFEEVLALLSELWQRLLAVLVPVKHLLLIESVVPDNIRAPMKFNLAGLKE